MTEKAGVLLDATLGVIIGGDYVKSSRTDDELESIIKLDDIEIAICAQHF